MIEAFTHSGLTEPAPLSWTPMMAQNAPRSARSLSDGGPHMPRRFARRRGVRTSTESVSAVVLDLGITPATLRHRLDARRPQPEGPLTDDEGAELRRLRKEVRELRMEREILKMTAFFAKQSECDLRSSLRRRPAIRSRSSVVVWASPAVVTMGRSGARRRSTVVGTRSWCASCGGCTRCTGACTAGRQRARPPLCGGPAASGLGGGHHRLLDAHRLVPSRGRPRPGVPPRGRLGAARSLATGLVLAALHVALGTRRHRSTRRSPSPTTSASTATPAYTRRSAIGAPQTAKRPWPYDFVNPVKKIEARPDSMYQ
jgi:transposase